MRSEFWEIIAMESREPSRKRKLPENSSLQKQEEDQSKDEQLLIKRSKSHYPTDPSFFHIKRTMCESEDSRSYESLDLELNLLPCKSGTKHRKTHESSNIFFDLNQNQNQNNNNENKNKDVSDVGLILKRASSPSVEDRKEATAVEAEEEEMVAMVCTKCHMLVMLCKSSPVCPNCKFLHSYEQSSQKLLKLLSLLC